MSDFFGSINGRKESGKICQASLKASADMTNQVDMTNFFGSINECRVISKNFILGG